MEWVFLVIGAVVVFSIAAAFVGSEAFRLGHSLPAAVFDVDEAVDHVASALPDDAQGRLSYGDVRTLILATLEHLEAKGISAAPGHEPTSSGEGPPVVIADDDAVAVVLGAVEADGLDVDDADVLVVIDRLLGYLGEIGALGPRVPPPADPAGPGGPAAPPT